MIVGRGLWSHKRWHKLHVSRRAVSLSVFIVAAMVGTAAVTITSAATYAIQHEAELGEVLGQAAAIVDPTASAASVVRFGGSGGTTQGVVDGTLAGVDTTKVRNANAQLGINTDIWEDNQQRRPAGW